MSSKYIYGSYTFQGLDGRYHYTYRITNLQENKHYYGVRTTKVDPYSDLGTKYFSSSKILAPIVKQNPELFKFKILKCFKTRKEAATHEFYLHKKFDVGRNLYFYNLTTQKSTKFDPTGTCVVFDEENKIISLSVNDPRLKSGEVISINKGKSLFKNSECEIFRLSIDDERISSDKLVHIFKDTVTVKTKSGKTLKVSVNDPRYKSGELVHISKGMFTAKDSEGNTLQISKNDTKFISGELVGLSKGTVVVQDNFGNKLRVPSDDIRIKTGELTHLNKGKVNVVDSEGNKMKVSKDDPRLISGELVCANKERKMITNGISNTSIMKDEIIPYGWYRGITRKTKRDYLKSRRESDSK